MRRRVPPFALVASVAWLSPVTAGVALAFASGGYFIRDWGLASIALLAILAAACLAMDVSFGGRVGVVAAGGLAGLATWQGISSAWAFQPSASIAAMNLTLMYAAAFTLGLIGVRQAADLVHLTWAAMAGAAVVAAYALGTRLLPDLISGDARARLSEPLSYWNGLGVLVAFGALLAIGIAGNRRQPIACRAVAAALVPLFLLGLMLTYSRGAVLALIVATALLIALSPERLETALVLVLCLGVSAPLLLAANGDDRIAGISGTLPAHADDGRRYLVFLLLTMAGAAAVTTGAALLLRRLPSGARRLSGAGLGVAVAALVVAMLAVNMPDEGPVDWTRTQVNSFKTFDTAARANAESVQDRLAVAAGSGRWQNWGVAIDEFQDSPVVGTGAGDYVFYWQQSRDIDLTVQNAHSHYLEVLAETGIVGLALLCLPIGAVVLALIRFLPRRSPEAPTVVVAVAAASLVALHAAGDWDWQLAAVVLPAMVLAGGALKMTATTERTPSSASRIARSAIAIAAVAGILVVAGPTASAMAVDDARTLAARGALNDALTRAREAELLAPQDPSIWRLEGNILADLGRFAESDAAFAAAARRSSRDWTIFSDWGGALVRRGDLAAGQRAIEHAQTLNPRESRPRLQLQSVDDGR